MNACLQVTIQILIRVQLWRVGRQVEDLYFIVVFSKPCLDLAGIVSTQIVEYQKYFALGVIGQSLLNHSFLPHRHTSTGTFPAPSGSCLRSFGASVLVLFDPTTNGEVMDTNLLTNLSMGVPAGFPHAYGLLAFFFQGCGRKGSGTVVHVTVV